MKNKHTWFLLFLGWLIAAFFPPQAALAMVSGKRG